MEPSKPATLAIVLLVYIAIPTDALTLSLRPPSGANETADCTAEDGTIIPFGKDKLYAAEQTCTVLQCSEHGLNKLVAECVAPRCVDPRRKPGACCLSCPEGFNCLLPSGEILDAESVHNNGTTRCVCPTITDGLGWDQDLVNAVCEPVTTTPAPTTPPPPSCFLPNWERMEVGEVRMEGREDGGCRRYECQEGGQLVVKYGDCPAVDCAEPVRLPGACCMTCPDDPDMASEPETYVTSPAPVTQPRRKVFVMKFGLLLRALLGAVFGSKPSPPALPHPHPHPWHRPPHHHGRPHHEKPHHGRPHHGRPHHEIAPETPMAEGVPEPEGQENETPLQGNFEMPHWHGRRGPCRKRHGMRSMFP